MTRVELQVFVLLTTTLASGEKALRNKSQGFGGTLNNWFQTVKRLGWL